MTERWTRGLAAAAALAGIGALLCAGAAERRGDVVTIVHPSIVYGLLVAGWAAWMTLVVGVARTARGLGATWLPGLALLALGVTSCASCLLQRTLWRHWDRVPGADEPHLVALTSGFVDHSIVMADVESKGLACDVYRIVAHEPDEGIHRAPFLVRPTGMSDAAGVVARNGYVAVVTSICWGAVRKTDLERARETRTPAVFDQSGDPFLLVGPDDTVDETDVAALVRSMSESEPDFFHHLPEPAAIEKARQSSNPSVRAAAERLPYRK